MGCSEGMQKTRMLTNMDSETWLMRFHREIKTLLGTRQQVVPAICGRKVHNGITHRVN